MKELSIREKAKRYDELKVTAQELEHDGCFDKITLFDLFPELLESEDERTRKDIIKWINQLSSDKQFESFVKLDFPRFIAWLEKQGEKGIVLRDTFGYEEGRQKGQEEGIMLVLDNPQKYGLEKQGEQKPKRMISAEAKEAMYDRPAWSEEDQETIDYLIDYLEDKLDCSYTDLDKETFTKEITLLKSIKDRVQPQPKQDSTDRYFEGFKKGEQSVIENYGKYGLCKPAEWSEEDEKMLEYAIDMIEWYSVVDKSKSRRVSDWLKSLRPNHWKPSDEQMRALDAVCNKMPHRLTLGGFKWKFKEND